LPRAKITLSDSSHIKLQNKPKNPKNDNFNERKSELVFNHVTDSIAERPEQHMINYLDKILPAVLTMQHIYRERLNRRFLRWWFKRHRAATWISRLYRGYCARIYSSSYRLIRSSASVKVQSVRRGYTTRRWTRKWMHDRMTSIAIIQPLAKQYVVRKREKFAAENKASATLLQCIIRGHLARCFSLRFKAMKYFETVVVPCTQYLQATFRGCRDRTYIKKQVMPLIQHRRKTHIAVLAMQSLLRGVMGRRKAKLRKLEDRGAKRIQAIVFGFLARRHTKQLRRMRKMCRDAVVIQRIIRGWIDREMVKDIQLERHHFAVRVPAAIDLQRVYRSYAERERARIAIIRWNSAIKVVNFWRFCKAMLVFHQKWLLHLESRRYNLAAQFQKIVRGYQARCYTANLRRMVHGTQIKAVIVLQCAYRKYSARKALEKQRKIAEDYWSNNCIAESNEDAEVYANKIKALQKRIRYTSKARKMAQRKISVLRSAKYEHSQRIPAIEKELQQLDDDEIQNGWADALEEEWEQRTNCLDMMSEEILQLRCRVHKASQLIEADTLEIEELEIDLEECYSEVCEEYQIIRIREINRLEVKMRHDYIRNVSQQRKKWRIREGNRKKTVERFEKVTRQHKIDSLPKAMVPKVPFLSVAYSKMFAYEENATKKKGQMLKQDDRRRYVTDKLNAHDHPSIPEAFDRVVKASQKVLMDFDYASTLGRRSVDPTVDTSGMCLQCGKMHCSCHHSDNSMHLF